MGLDAVFQFSGGLQSGRIISSKGVPAPVQEPITRFHKDGSYTVIHPFIKPKATTPPRYDKIQDGNGNHITIERNAGTGRAQKYFVHNKYNDLLEKGSLEAQERPFGPMEFYTKTGNLAISETDLSPDQHALKQQAINRQQENPDTLIWNVQKYNANGELSLEEIRPAHPACCNEHGIPHTVQCDQGIAPQV
jgi:hypothetical protein